jgi:predicted RNA-binding protein with PIN domain
MKIFLIDGNNVIHKVSTLQTKLQKSYILACSACIQYVYEYAHKYSSYKFIIFFDKLAEDLDTPLKNISVMSSMSQIADEQIKDHIAKSISTKNLTLVTSDTDLYNFGRVHACDTITSEQFIKLLSGTSISQTSTQSTKSKNNRKNEKPNSASKKEINEFKKLFGVD